MFRIVNGVAYLFLLRPRLSELRIYLSNPSIVKLDALDTHGINITSSIAPSLLLVLLLCETFSLRHYEIFMRAVRVVVRHVRVRGETLVNFDIGRDPAEWHVVFLLALVPLLP